MTRELERAVAAIRNGGVVVLPTDTVYGLVAYGLRPEPVAALYRLKGRGAGQPTALVAASVDVLTSCLPELTADQQAVLRALLPGPLTLVVSNPACRYRWLTGPRPAVIGVRVPDLEGPAAEVLRLAGPVAATSANLPGGQDPRSLVEVPAQLIEGAAAVVDGGGLPGVASTVLDLTGREPVVLREGAVDGPTALERARRAVAGG